MRTSHFTVLRRAGFVTLLHLMLAAAGAQPARADEVIFDAGALAAEGLDAGLASQFQHGDRFPPGLNTVTLFVNGRARGRARATFDARGELCPDVSLLRQAGIAVPPRFAAQPGCRDLRRYWPQIAAEASPADGSLRLLVPESALDPDADAPGWEHGGSAALLNYSAQYMGSRARESRMDYWQIQSEAGFNAGDWILRSSQNIYRFGARARADFQNAYASRTFTGLKSTVDIGQIPLAGGLFSVGQVRGLQVTPERALYGDSGPAVVTGIANGPSVVEIRQLGVPVYHTSVPAGPFSLSRFSLLNTRTDLSVTVTGADGSRQRYLVPASAYVREGAAAAPGVAWGIGRYAGRGAEKKPLLATASLGIPLSARAALQAGGLWAQEYQALGASLSSVFLYRTSATLQSTLSRTGQGARRGMLHTFALAQPLGESLTLGLNGAHQGRGYREFSEAQFRGRGDYARNKDQVGASASWTTALLGSVSLAAGRSTQTRGAPIRWMQLGWGRQFGKVTLSVNAARQQSGGRYGREDRVYLSLQLPLASDASLSSTASRSRGADRYGTRLDRRLDEGRSWSLAVDRDTSRSLSAATGSYSALTRWSDVSTSLSLDTARSRSLSLQASGSVVAHRGGVTAAPWQVRDTFGIARVGTRSGVRLETPSGPVWTDGGGYAIVPALSGWRTSAVEVDTRSLGRRADVVNGTASVSPARGAVSRIEFETVSTRRVLVDARRSGGARLPAGAGVRDGAGNFITVVDELGELFLPDARPDEVISVSLESGECRIRLSELPAAPAQESAPYETIGGVCREE